MAMLAQCDFCGETIANERLMIRLTASGGAYDPRYQSERGSVYGDVAHYHATEDRPCWAEMLDRISLIHDVSSSLGPSTTDLERRAREKAEKESWNKKWLERKNAWRRISTEQRESFLFQALANDRLLVRELASRMNAHLGFSSEDQAVGEYELRPLVKRMFDAGELVREGESFRGKIRYRYFRSVAPGLEQAPAGAVA